MVGDNQLKLILQERKNKEMELNDNELEALVRDETLR
jgi:hypothetical protein